jgi:glycerol-3-phosphate dehydrogenase
MAGGFDAYLAAFRARHGFLPDGVARRLVRAYGSRAEAVVAGAARWADMGEDFGGGLTAAEVRYLVEREFAVCAEDILWRRSKLGLHVPEGTAARIDAFLGAAAA